MKIGKSSKALEDYNSAIELDGEDPDLYFNRGLIYQATRKVKDANADFEKANELRSESGK